MVGAATLLGVLPAIAAGTAPPSQGAPSPALIKRYHTVEVYEGQSYRNIDRMLYQPRSFQPGTDIDSDVYGSALVDDAGPYDGWDVLTPGRNWNYVTRSEWLHFTLTRPAKAAIVWRTDKRPAWMNSWSRGGNVVIDGRSYPVYVKHLDAGRHALGGAATSSEGVRTYLLLLAEENGSATPAPLVPNGRPEVEPNTLCPQWRHDSYTTVGPDGESYGTWHPQIDPVYWCYFGHDHGSDPSLIPGSPKVPYQYVASKVPQTEPDVGFKEFIFKYKGYYVRLVEHASTAMSRRVCARFHTMYVMVYDADGKEKYRSGFKADFGAAISGEDKSVLTGSNCGYNMAAVQVATNAFRRFRMDPDTGDYEVWRTFPTSNTTNLGLVLNHVLDIRDPYSFCPDKACAEVELHHPDRNQTETRRTLRMEDFEIRAAYALATGTFHTDAFGRNLVDAGAGNAVEQYVAPGFTLVFPSDDFRCEVVDPWSMRYACDGDNTRAPRSNLERGTRPMSDGDLPNVSVNHPTCNGHLATIIGTEGDDELTGTPLADVIVGLGGNDVLKGMGGDDIICGGGGRDRIIGGPGDDVMYGNGGLDRMRGSAGSDVLFGGQGNDRLNGGGSRDVVAGQAGADILSGGAGADLLLGGPQNDDLTGGLGADVLRGQGGTDSCLEPDDLTYSCE